MTDDQCIKLAEQYLSSRAIGYLPPGHVKHKEENNVEVVFAALGTDDPAVAVVDPPDVRLLVTISDRTVELICQM